MDSARISMSESNPLYSLAEVAGDSIVVVDADGLILYANPATGRVFGYSRRELLEKRLFDLMAETHREACETGLRHAAAAGQDSLLGRKIEMSGLRRRGDKFPIEFSLSLWPGEDGRPCFTGILRDVSGRRQTEGALRERAALLEVLKELHETVQQSRDLRSLVRQVYDAFPRLLQVDRASVLLYNETMGGLVSDSLLGVERVHEKLVSSAPQPVGHSISGKCFADREAILIDDCSQSNLIPREDVERLRLKSTLALPLLIVGRPIGVLRLDDCNRTGRFSQENLEFFKMVAEQLALVVENARLFARFESAEAELTRVNQELEQARDAAIDASRAKSAFLANMSHEFRTPLNAVIGYAEMLDEDLREAGLEKFCPDLDKIRSASDHLLSLISNVLDVARIEAGRLELHCETIHTAELLEETAAIVRPLIESNRNILTLVHAPSPSMIYADRTRLRQILLNLLSNAAKFCSSGEVTLECFEEEAGSERPFVVFRVTDTGYGLSREQIEKLFQKFQQFENPAKRRQSGAGLGLVITRNLCEAMHGRIDVDSTPGKGSVFTVRIPRDAAAVTE